MAEELGNVALDEAAEAVLRIPGQTRRPDETDDIVDSDIPAQRPADVPEDGLTERERHILSFERRWWRHAGAKEQAIKDTFGVSATRYYQSLNALLDNQAALAAEPVLVGRLRRLRLSRARTRG